MAVFLLSNFARASSNTLLVGTGPYYQPYYEYHEGIISGVLPDIVKAAAKIIGIESVIFTGYPWKRNLISGQQGVVDAILPVSRTEERSKYLYYPDEQLVDEKVCFFSKRSLNFHYSGDLMDLKPYIVGVVDGYSYGKEFDQAKFIRRESSSKEERMVKKLRGGRFDVGIGNLDVISYHLEEIGYLDQISVHQPCVSIDPLYLAFSKIKGESHRKMAQDFSNALKEIKNNGTYDKILAKHNIK